MTGVFDIERVDVRDGEIASRLVRALSHSGVALLEYVRDLDALLDATRTIAAVVPHRDSEPNGATILTDSGAGRTHEDFAGFSNGALAPHTDRSSVERPPFLLLMACGKAAEAGGESVLVDGAAVYADLAETAPGAVRALSRPRSVLFGGSAGYLGSVFTYEPNGRATVRLRLDNLARFSLAAGGWCDALRDAIDRNAITVPLRTGEGYVLDNRRWLHGRRAFNGERLLYRVIAEPVPGITIPLGFPLEHLPIEEIS